MSDDEFDEFGGLPDLFDNIDWNAIPELSDSIAAQPPQAIPDVQAESAVGLEGLNQEVGSPDSSQYSCDEIQLDETVLGLLDALEERGMHGNGECMCMFYIRPMVNSLVAVASTSLQQQPAATTGHYVTAGQ